MHHHQNTAQFLAISGTIPFIFLTMLHLMQATWLTINPEIALLRYGAIIVSFIAGVHWGHAINQPKVSHLLWHSNIAALLAWVAAMQLVDWSGLLLLVCFIYLLVLDFGLFKRGIISTCFWRTRLQASSIVILSLLTYLLSV